MANKKKSSKNVGVRQKTHDGVDKIMDKAQSMNENSKRAAEKMRDNIEGYIQDNLKKSMVIALSFGAVVGAVLITAMRRNS